MEAEPLPNSNLRVGLVLCICHAGLDETIVQDVEDVPPRRRTPLEEQLLLASIHDDRCVNMKVLDRPLDTAHRQLLEVRLANDLRESSEHSRVGLDPCDELVEVLDGNPLHGSAASSSCPPRKAGPVGFEPTTFGSLHFIGAGARCPILVVLAGDLLRSPVI